MEEKNLILSPMIAEKMMHDEEYRREISKLIARYLTHDYGKVTPQRVAQNDRILQFHRNYGMVQRTIVPEVNPFDLAFAKYEQTANGMTSIVWVFEEKSLSSFSSRIWMIKPEEYHRWFLPMRNRKDSA